MAPPTTAPQRSCTRCRTLVDADALFCPACREPMATSLFSLEAVAPPAPRPAEAVVVDRQPVGAGPPAPSMSSGLELALPTRCKVCGGTLTDEAMQRRGTCVLHAHLTGAEARPMATAATTSSNGRAIARDDDRPPGTGPLGAVIGLAVVAGLGGLGWWWVQHDTAPSDDALVATNLGGSGAPQATAPAGPGLTPTEATERVDELLGGGASGRLAQASTRAPPMPAALATRTDDDAVSAEVEQLIAQSGHPTAPDLGEYEAVLDGTADAAPGPTARAFAAMGELDDDDARAAALRKLDTLQARFPDDAAVAAARAEVHVDDDPDAALVAAAGTADVADAARLRGHAFARKGDIDGAVAALAATADRDPRATRALVALQAPRGRCADVEAASARLAAARGAQAVVDHVRLLAACRPTLDDARALVEAVAHLPSTTDAERTALRSVLAEAALARGREDVVDRACTDVGAGNAVSADVARAQKRCALLRPDAAATALQAVQGSQAPSSTALLRAFGVRDARTSPWGRAGAQLRWVGALHDGTSVAAALVEVVEALWAPATVVSRVPAFGAREQASLVSALVPEARRGVALAVARGLAGDVDGGLAALGEARDVDAAAARAVLLVAKGRFDEARKAQPPSLATTVVGRAIAAFAPSTAATALRALLSEPHVGPRAYRALVERGASTPADAALAQRFALHPDVIAAKGR